MTHIPYILRKITEKDTNFIYNSFLKSYRNTYPMTLVPDTLYFKPQSEVIEFLLETAECFVAVYPEDPSEIIGYIIYQNMVDAAVIHYIYIKNHYRGSKIAIDIVNSILSNYNLIIATHICNSYSKLKNKINNCEVIYDPFLIGKLKKINVK